jgi:hypothetical protein
MLVLFYAVIAGAVGLLAWLSIRDPLMRRGIIRKPKRKRRGDYD